MNILSFPNMNGRPQDDLDRTLHAFFRTQMPAAWPEPSELELAPPPRLMKVRRSIVRAYGRMTLAASILMLFVGYLALAGNFPKGDTGQGIAPQGDRMIGKGVGIHHPPQTDRLKHGGEGVSWGETVPGAPGQQPMIIINVDSLKKSAPRR